MTISRDLALDVAHRIARRLASTAIWDDQMCTWNLYTFDREAPPGVIRGRTERAGGTIYNGTAGIALFLMEAARVTGDATLLRTAEGAVAFARATVAGRRGPMFGFHSGSVGIAYALAKLGIQTGNDSFLVAARQLLAPLAGREHEDTGIDVIAGAAGAIPALIQLSSIMASPVPAEMARRLGEHLLSIARRGPYGWSWGTLPHAARGLMGYAHGVAGIAQALGELYAATGDARFRYAAEQGVAYERHYFDESAANWPDFRHVPLTEYMARGTTLSPAEQVAYLRTLRPHALKLMCAWCHGASGIGLGRLRMYELLGDSVYGDDARMAVSTVVESLAKWRVMSFGMCHGVTTDCETLLLAGRVLGDDDARGLALDIAEEAAQTFELAGTPWRSGTVGAEPDPSLMLGDAGIGYFYLRIASPDVEPVALLRAPATATAHLEGTRSTDASRFWRADAARHFGMILTVLTRVAPDEAPLGATPPRPGESGIPELFTQIASRIDAEPDDLRRQQLLDAFAIERARFELAAEIPPACDLTIAQLWRKFMPPRDWSLIDLVVAPAVRLIELRWDWPAWLRGSASLGEVPPADHVHVAVSPRDGEMIAWPIEPLPAFILHTLVAAGGELSFEGVLAEVQGAMLDSSNARDAASVRATLIDQIESLERAGVMTIRQRTIRPAAAFAAPAMEMA